MLPGSGKNLVRLPGKLTQPKKYGWITDTALSTFYGLAIVYREDILSRDKRLGCFLNNQSSKYLEDFTKKRRFQIPCS